MVRPPVDARWPQSSDHNPPRMTTSTPELPVFEPFLIGPYERKYLTTNSRSLTDLREPLNAQFRKTLSHFHVTQPKPKNQTLLNSAQNTSSISSPYFQPLMPFLLRPALALTPLPTVTFDFCPKVGALTSLLPVCNICFRGVICPSAMDLARPLR